MARVGRGVPDRGPGSGPARRLDRERRPRRKSQWLAARCLKLLRAKTRSGIRPVPAGTTARADYRAERRTGSHPASARPGAVRRRARRDALQPAARRSIVRDGYRGPRQSGAARNRARGAQVRNWVDQRREFPAGARLRAHCASAATAAPLPVLNPENEARARPAALGEAVRVFPVVRSPRGEFLRAVLDAGPDTARTVAPAAEGGRAA